MGTIRLAGRVVLLLVAATVAVGCEKKVNLQFVNGTAQAREVELAAPQAGVVRAGVVPAGGRLAYSLKFDEDDLPANCSWRAGDQRGSFSVDKNTPKDLRILIGPVTTIGPIKKDDEVRQRREVEVREVPVEQREVVE